VLSKYFLLARYVNELTVHGALEASSLMVTTPWLVDIAATNVPLGRGDATGVPTFLAAGGAAIYAQDGLFEVTGGVVTCCVATVLAEHAVTEVAAHARVVASKRRTLAG
jgi:hypothetical protein